MSKELLERNPFTREGTASRKIYVVLAKSPKPMTPEEVAKATRLPLAQTRTLLAAYRNPFHSSPLLVRGVTVLLSDGKFSLKLCKPQPNAKRPPRGMNKGKKATAKATRKPAKAKPKPPSKPKKVKATPKVPDAPAPALDTTAALIADNPGAAAN